MARRLDHDKARIKDIMGQRGSEPAGPDLPRPFKKSKQNSIKQDTDSPIKITTIVPKPKKEKPVDKLPAASYHAEIRKQREAAGMAKAIDRSSRRKKRQNLLASLRHSRSKD